MTPNGKLGVAGVATFLVCLGTIAYKSSGDFSDGEAAVRNVDKLTKGMTMFQAVAVLHPERTKREARMSCATTAITSDTYAMTHALTRDRYLIMTYVVPPPRAKSDITLKGWELREGFAPREDVTFGRVLSLGRFHLPY